MSVLEERDPKRIGILVVAYNAASTLAKVLDRIPPEFAGRVSRILVCDDHSQDSTYLIGLGYQQNVPHLPITVIRHARNLGYGGNQKAGYRWAIDHGLDIIVLLHGDGQYAPEYLPEIVAPLERGECDCVLGSRLIEKGAARRGGMPLYKYAGNRILTTAENTLVGTSLSEWHSGYRAYSVEALGALPFEENDDGFSFDTQIIVQLIESGHRILEIPIPTYYGDEVCYVNGIGYARDVITHVARYRAHKMGFGSGETAFASQAYDLKTDDESSHGVVLSWLAETKPLKVLDLGCSDGSLGERLRKLGHDVTGVDADELPGVADRVDRFVLGDLETGVPTAAGDGYGVVVLADVLEHVRHPEVLLRDACARVGPGGYVVASIPNAVHWYPRLRMLLGRFDYDRRGILDASHLRFFTRRSFERLARRAGCSVARTQPVGLPLEALDRGGTSVSGRFPMRMLRFVDSQLSKAWPNLFAYQYVFRLEPHVAAGSGGDGGDGQGK